MRLAAARGDAEACLLAMALHRARSRLLTSLRCVGWAILQRLLSSNVRRPTKAGAAHGWLASVLRSLAH